MPGIVFTNAASEPRITESPIASTAGGGPTGRVVVVDPFGRFGFVPGVAPLTVVLVAGFVVEVAAALRNAASASALGCSPCSAGPNLSAWGWALASPIPSATVTTT